MSENGNTNSKDLKGIQLSLDQPAPYRIRILGDLAKHWSDRLGGMWISKQVDETGLVTSTLEGELIDQAALFGVLKALYVMRLPLISVEYLQPAEKVENDLLKVNVKQKDAYIEFTVTGTYDLQRAIEKFPLVIMACRQTGISKAWVDYRGLAGEIMLTQSLLYAHRAGEFHQEHLSSGGRPLRIAFVGNERMPENISEAIGKTYGLEGIVTSDYQEAVDWLCVDD